MTYNQVQLFQINDYANHYVDIEITGYRALYSKSIAGRDVARFISWLGTAGPNNVSIIKVSSVVDKLNLIFHFYC